MHVIDGLAQDADDGQGIHLLPEEVRWVEVGADDGPDGLSHALEGGHVVDELQWMQLEGDLLDAMIRRVRHHRLPERDRLVPLARQEGRLVIRPGRPDPVQSGARRPVSGTTGHGHDLVDAQACLVIRHM